MISLLLLILLGLLFTFLLINPLWSFYLCVFIAGTYITSWRELKIPFSGFLINPYDLVFITLIFSFYLRSMIDKTYFRVKIKNLFFLLVITLFYAIVSGFLGARNGNKLVDILRDFRIFFFFLSMVYISTFFFKSMRDIVLFGKVLIAIGILISIEQFGYFLVHLNVAHVSETRNITIQAQIIPFSLAYLYCFRNSFKFSILNKFWFLVVFLYLFAISISFTRSIYVQTLLTLFSVIVMSSKTPVSSILKMIASLTFFVIVSGSISKFLWQADINQGAIQRLSLFFAGSKDVAVQYRLSEFSYAFKMFLSHPIFGTGLGSRIIFLKPKSQEMEVALFLHNSFLWFLVKSGVVGTLLILWFYLKSFINIFKIISRDVFFKKYRAFYLSSMLPFVLINSFSGNLSYAPFLIFLGVMIGQSMSVYYLEKKVAYHGSDCT
ncbi:MAG: O-antigen ligase family protein [Candidatus Omnitrophica bacterium]|nr:O-antigen ligase family protein [Candidatus Omnitrophota bacterium]